MNRKWRPSGTALILVTVVLSVFAAGFLLGQSTVPDNKDDTDSVLGRFLYAGVVTERVGGGAGSMEMDNLVAMNSTNERLRNQERIQNALDRAVEINGTDEDEPGVSHDVREDISREEYMRINRVLGGVPYYDVEGLEGHAVRHRGEIVFVGTSAPANDTVQGS